MYVLRNISHNFVILQKPEQVSCNTDNNCDKTQPPRQKATNYV